MTPEDELAKLLQREERLRGAPDQDQVVFEKDLGKDTADAAKAMARFNPDNTWTALK